MQEHTTIPFPHPQLTAADPFTEVLRQGAQRLLAQAIEAEIAVLLAQYAGCHDPQGRQAVVRNECSCATSPSEVPNEVAVRVCGAPNEPAAMKPEQRAIRRIGRAAPYARNPRNRVGQVFNILCCRRLAQYGIKGGTRSDATHLAFVRSENGPERFPRLSVGRGQRMNDDVQ